MSKRYPLVAMAATAALVVSGCGGVGGDDEGGDAGGAATLTTMGFGVGDEIASTRVDLADKAIAPSKVKIGGNAFDAQQFLSAVASDNPPDLVFMDRQLIGTYAARGTLTPLEDCVSQGVDRPRPVPRPRTRGGHARRQALRAAGVLQQPRPHDQRRGAAERGSDAGRRRHVRRRGADRADQPAHEEERRRPGPHRLRPEDPGVPADVGAGQRRRHDQQGRQEGEPRRPRARRGAGVRGQPDQRAGRLGRLQGLP